MTGDEIVRIDGGKDEFGASWGLSDDSLHLNESDLRNLSQEAGLMRMSPSSQVRQPSRSAPSVFICSSV